MSFFKKYYMQLTKEIKEEHLGKRLDKILALLFSEYSRTKLNNALKQGKVVVDGYPKLKSDLKILKPTTVNITIEDEIIIKDKAQNISLEIVYEDEYFLALNKPANMVVHPGAGVPDGTVLNALLAYNPTLANLPRCGIVHRIDKDTTGLLLVAKNINCFYSLCKNISLGKIKREYLAIANGQIIAGKTINAPITRHPRKRTIMAVRENGKESITHIKILKKYPSQTLLRIKLQTGRTHQIRVHMQYAGAPLVGDKAYGARPFLDKSYSEKLKDTLQKFNRQALHAKSLSFLHPITKKEIDLIAPTPLDLDLLIQKLNDG